MKKLLAVLLCLGILSSPLTVMQEVEAASPSPPAPEVVTYEKPNGYTLPDGVVADRATKYTVTVNDQPVGLYPAMVGLAADTTKTAKSAYGYFDFSGSVTVKITTDFDFSSVTVRPLSQGITPQVNGRTVTFTLASPSNLSVEFDGNLQENLQLFSNFIETPDFGDAQIHYVEPGNHSPKEILASLDAGKANVVYFKPGVHVLPSNEIFYIPSNTTVYVAGGAVVYGRLHGQDATNIRIIGRGVINGSKLDRRADFGDGPQSYMMRFVRCKNVEVNGIILQDSPHWTFVNIECEKVNVRNFRIVGQRRSNNDGMDIVNCRNFTVDHAFVRTIDDALTVKGKYIGGERNQVSNITIQNSVIWNEDSGNAQEIGFETLTDKFSNIIFRNNDVIHNNSGGTMTMHNGDTAEISGVVNDDIRVEGKTNNGSLVEMFIRDTYYSTSVDRGSINGVTFNRIRYLPQDDRGSTMNGYDANSTIKNVSFHDLVINGKQITGPYEAGKGQFSYDQFVEAPTFSADPVKFEPLSGAALYEGENLSVSGASSTVRDNTMANAGKYADIDLSAAGNSAQTTFTAPAGAHYIPIINVHKGPDGGIVKILVDGKDHGYWLDTYCQDEIWQAYTMTDLYLAAGGHTLTFQAVSKHLNSSGFHFGFDYLNLTMPDDTTYEAENSAAAVANGQASCGYYASLPLQSGQASITVPVSDDRISNLKLRLLSGPDKGRVNLLLDGVPQGNAADLYSDTAGFKEFSFGTARLSAGNHTFVMQSTDQKDSALELDYIRFGAFPQTVLWRARRLYNNTYYSSSSTTTTTGDTYDTASTVTTQFGKAGDWANYVVTVPADGFYTVVARMDAGPDKGSYKVSANGAEFDGTVADAYQSSAGTKRLNFGSVYLRYGENDLKFTCTGKNALSSGYFFTLNAIELAPGVTTAASEDSYTFADAASSDKNFGTEQLMTIKPQAPGGGGERRAYVKYNLSTFGDKAPQTAEFRFTAKEFDTGFLADYRTLELYAVPGSWQETSITWNNQPSIDGAEHLGTVKVTAAADAQYAVDISEYLQKNWSKLGGNLSLLLVNTTDGADQKSKMSIYSRESGDKGPVLWTSSRPIEVKSFSVDPDSVTMWPDISRELTASVLPENADADIVWHSDNEGVATVNTRGVVTAHSQGTATITATLNGKFTDTVSVSVVPKEVYEKTMTPKADTYAWSDTKDTNYGTAQELVVKALNNGGGGRKSLLDFDYSDYGGTRVERATLRLCLKSTDEVFGKDNRTLNLSAVNEKWQETGVTWNIFPKAGEQIASFQVGRSLDKWYEVDVTDYINENAARLNGRTSFLVDNTTDGADQKNKLSFYSRESGDKAPQLVIVGEGGNALPRLSTKADFAVTNIWSDGEVQTDDSLQTAVEQGRATMTMNGANAGVLADATERYNVGGEMAMPKDSQGVVTIALPSDFGGSRTIKDMDILMRTGASDAKAYDLSLYYSTTANPDSYKLFYSATNKNDLSFEVYPYIRLSGFNGQVSDVANIRVVSNPVAGDAPVLQEIDLNFTTDDSAVAAARQVKQETLRMPTLFADNMVLQRNKAIRIWGWGGKDTVSVSLTKQGQSTPASQASASVQNGQWLAELPALEGGNDAYTLTVTSNGKSLNFTGVLIGDVYLASGQSNMALFVKDTSTRDKDVAAADDDNIRFFTQDFTGACQAKDDVPTGKWSKAVGSTIDNYYAVAYHFAKEVSDKTSGSIPVAVLSAATPGTWIECWMDENLLNGIIRDNLGKTYLNDYLTKSKGGITRAADYERRAVAPYNAMLNPLTNANIAGIVWYQGENNSGMVDSYRAALPRFIADLRSKFRDNEKIPFLAVQLPAFAAGPSGWSSFRLMQGEVIKQTQNAYLAVTIDCADNPNNIHPTDKTVVGQRLAAIALNKIYGQNVVYSGPEFSGAELQGNKLILSFGGAAEGLNAKGGDTVNGFEISEDGVNFVAAQGKLVNGKVEVTAPDISFPQFVRYACVPYPSPMANLYNGAGFPTAPFTADVSTDAVYVKLSAGAAVLYPTVTKQLTAAVLPADKPQGITWSSSDTSVATVDSNGLVTAVAEGTAKIYATASSGAFSSATITVKPWEKLKQTQSPTDDAFVYDYEQNGNHGKDVALTVKPVFTNGSGERRSFLKFDFSGYGGEKLNKAVLRLCLKEADSPFPYPPLSGYTDRTIELYLTADSWTESALTWGNQPAAGQHIATFKVPPTLEQWCEIDLTDILNANLDKLSGVLSLEVKNITDNKDQKSRISFYSKESGDKGPQLILEGQDVYTSVTNTVAVSTEAGTAPLLPASVDATLTTGAGVQAPVTWDAISSDQYKNPGSFTVIGHVAGYDGTVEATVTVTEPKEVLDKAALAASIQKAQEDKLHYPANLSDEIRNQFETALAHAMEVYSNAGGTYHQSDINAAVDSLNQADRALFAANLQKLENAIAHAQEVIASGKYKQDEAMTRYNSALQAAVGLKEAGKLTDTDLNPVLQLLTETEAELQLIPPTLELSALKEVLSRAEALNLTQYQDGAEKDAFQKALSDAKDALNRAQNGSGTQQEIDQTSQLLNNAMSALKKAETPGQQPEGGDTKLVDQPSSITVSAPKGVLEEGTQLSVQRISSGPDFELTDKALEDIGGRHTLWDISLLRNNAKVQPNGTVTVSLPVPEGYDTSRLELYRINTDGTRDKIPFTVSNGIITFSTPHFSLYSVVETKNDAGSATPEPASPPTGEAPFTSEAALALLSGTVLFYLTNKKRKR